MDYKQEIGELLATLNLEDLNSLVGTTTNYLIRDAFRKKSDAIDVIIRNSPDTRILLRRKKITTEVLANYLNIKKIPLTTGHTKENLIQSVLTYWDSLTTTVALRPENPVRITQDSSITSNTETESPTTDSRPVFDQTTHIESTNGTSETASYQRRNNNSITNELALKFAEWFYNIFNKNEPIDETHFWDDCNLKLNLKDGSNTIINSECVQGSAEETVKLLFRIKTEHGIFLNPNLLSEGVQGRMDNHGLVLVLVCGTIHKDNLCVGVFEQIFALIKDPQMSNNWRIKFSELNLRNQPSVSSTPRLTDSELTANLLQLPESELEENGVVSVQDN